MQVSLSYKASFAVIQGKFRCHTRQVSLSYNASFAVI